MSAALVVTHQRRAVTAEAVTRLVRAAHGSGTELRFSPEEAAKHGVAECPGIVVAPDGAHGADVVVVLGGDGTILGALRRFAGTGIPVFGVNFGEVGFLATVEPGGGEDDFARALCGDFDLLSLPAITLRVGDDEQTAINDVSLHRRAGERVAVLAYALAGEELGSVRCDGLVVATPAGSTGYNLANGGPVLAWGVEGYAVSFIAPHSLTARPMVAAPTDVLRLDNRSREDPVDVLADGRPVAALGPGEALECHFVHDAAVLAQLPGSTFHRRLREKFGKLA